MMTRGGDGDGDGSEGPGDGDGDGNGVEHGVEAIALYFQISSLCETILAIQYHCETTRLCASNTIPITRSSTTAITTATTATAITILSNRPRHF